VEGTINETSQMAWPKAVCHGTQTKDENMAHKMEVALIIKVTVLGKYFTYEVLTKSKNRY
jgi:hypothetical protein